MLIVVLFGVCIASGTKFAKWLLELYRMVNWEMPYCEIIEKQLHFLRVKE